jgi:hypothetical protein
MGLPSLSTFFNFKGPVEDAHNEMREIFPFLFTQDDFVRIDVVSIFVKILTDVVERSHGLSDDQSALLWDNCLKSSKNDGLITMLSKSIYHRGELFLVYDASVNVVREATQDEKVTIRSDYEKQAESQVGIYVSFKNFVKIDMIKLYSGLEHSTICSLYKTMNLSKAIQLKMSDLRSSTALNDSTTAVTQAKSIADGLAKGKDILLDSKDSIETATPQLDSTKASIAFLDAKRAFYLGLPSSYINGEQTGGMNANGDIDQRAVERGLRSYFFSIVKPVLEQLFKVKIKYKSQDTRQIAQALEALKVFELTDESLVSMEQKKAIIESLLDIDADENQNTTTPEEVPAAAPLESESLTA